MHYFANAVLEELDRASGAVWIHDFHLALLSALIKAERPTATVSVFWHIPWPSPDVWRILPERREMLLGVLASDVMVFQTSSHAEAFFNCTHTFMGAIIPSSRDRVLYNGYETRVSVRTISVDYRMIFEHAVSSSVEQAESVLRHQLGFRVGV